jgi:hypothetical protein
MPARLFVALILGLAVDVARADEEPVFSGPQVGEKLTPFKLNGVFGDAAGMNIDLIAQAEGGPLVIVFVHERTRPAFGLTNTVLRFAASRAKDGLQGAAVFLTGDATETQDWMKRVAGNFPTGVTFGISPDGQEGPGAYGLNRNVGLTVLVGKENKVTANFALVQPSVQADGPKIFKAIVDVLGGGDVPDVAQFSGQEGAGRMMRTDPMLERLFRQVVRKDASADEVQAALKALEDYVAANRPAQGQLGRLIAQFDAKSIESDAVKDKLAEWAKKYPAPAGGDVPARGAAEQDPNLRPLLTRVIRRDATAEQVDEAAKAVEDYASKNPGARKEIGRIGRTIVNGGKLADYGTPKAQEYLQKWAKEYADEASSDGTRQPEPRKEDK